LFCYYLLLVGTQLVVLDTPLIPPRISMLSKMAKVSGSSKVPFSKSKGPAQTPKQPKGSAGKTGKGSKAPKASVKGKVVKPVKPLVKVVDETLELPLVVYKLSIGEMLDICAAFHAEAIGGDYHPGLKCIDDTFKDVNICVAPEKLFEEIGLTPEELGPEKTAKFLTMLREHEDQSVVDPPESVEEDETVSEEHLTAQPYDEKELYALFYLYDEEKYVYRKIKIAASTIKAAGMGIYALEDIPDGAVGQYKGVPRIEDETNMYYAWVVKSFDPVEGLPDDADTYMYYIDATDFEHSNWTRYVNCGMTATENNMDQEQVYDKIFYTTTRAITAGEELFVDYGEEYRVWNFGMEAESY
jgi:hypothetical protein